MSRQAVLTLELEEIFQVFDWDLIVDIVLVRARLEDGAVVQGQVLHHIIKTTKAS